MARNREPFIGASLRVLENRGNKLIEVAADKKTFGIMAEIGAAYNFIHAAPSSKEDQRELARSPQLAAYVLDSKIGATSRKAGLIIQVPSGTPCEEIRRSRFQGSRLFPDEFVGVQIRITDGPHKGFEGWVFPGWISQLPSSVPTPRSSPQAKRSAG